ncbi:EcsC family protein [Phenylobacterium deserti]|uniref:EcsC family protein n=1 Tax=Phenylobacterium deserti TaxID=1914756 RepID=A0A328AUF2_9CAUL|nr:EcsC family protein [Phenylobacterium deserti]RAK56568.1 EcsC family protein [Phenylobacterium deserti]
MAATPPFGAPEDVYEAWVREELRCWRAEVLKPPGLASRAARGVQQRVNRIIPEKVHAAVTRVIEQMTRGILTGSHAVTARPLSGVPLSERDRRALAAIASYRTAAAAEGGVAGAGGFWLAVADFPALIAIKIKLLFDLMAIYGRSGEDFAERLYLLHIFELAFSSADHRAQVFHTLEDWDRREHPSHLDGFNWRSFQQEYRDYIDLAKMAQLIPLIGAPVGAVVNWRLTERVGHTAMNAYRMRWLAQGE